MINQHKNGNEVKLDLIILSNKELRESVYLRETTDTIVLCPCGDVSSVQQPFDFREDYSFHGRVVLQQKTDLVSGLGSNTSNGVTKFVDLFVKYI
jgi:hypothetical protein